ncbi:hypothetical protein C8R45DRAFT_489901 [Mycena sanguinolenta]|nr:hypothetical protein C8R45DRAFT_489901 [Mycena sanguinolenta]
MSSRRRESYRRTLDASDGSAVHSHIVRTDDEQCTTPPFPQPSSPPAHCCYSILPVPIVRYQDLSEAHHTAPAAPLPSPPMAHIAPSVAGADDTDAYVPAPGILPNTRNRRRRRSRNNNSQNTTTVNARNASSQVKRVQTNVNSVRPAKRGTTRAPHDPAVHEQSVRLQVDFTNVSTGTGGTGGAGGAGGIQGGSGGIGTGPVGNLNVFYFQR